jgi:hypothetical protein
VYRKLRASGAGWLLVTVKGWRPVVYRSARQPREAKTVSPCAYSTTLGKASEGGGPPELRRRCRKVAGERLREDGETMGGER